MIDRKILIVGGGVVVIAIIVIIVFATKGSSSTSSSSASSPGTDDISNNVPTNAPTSSPTTKAPERNRDIPPPGYTKGFCPPGYYDRTKGNPNNWGCGSACPGGSYTDGSCNCACVPNAKDV